MRHAIGVPKTGRGGISAWLFVGALFFLLPSIARGFDLNVVDQSGTPISAAYKWLVEEDSTHYVTPGVPDNNSLSTTIHRSHSPVVAYGTSADLSPLNDNGVIDPAKRYFISVLPEAGYSVGGAAVAAGQRKVKVLAPSHTVPTAQITVFVFHDNNPLNNAPDSPAERGLPNFRIQLFDQGGEQAADAFGNTLGTVYETDANGNVLVNPDGTPQAIRIPGNGIFTDNSGNAVMADGSNGIRYIAPGKYGVRAVPQDNLVWIQTATIEGTKGIDQWVRANEPPYFAEAGFFGVHVFIGFVHPTFLDPANLQSVSYGPQFRALNVGEAPGTLRGQVMSVHQSRPPLQPGLEVGRPATDAWVGLTDLNAADGLVYTSPCQDNGAFEIRGIPPGQYQLVMWDSPLDTIIDFRTVLIDNGAVVDLGHIPIYRWFGFFEGNVFDDVNRNGFRDPGEAGIADVAINLRFRDGTIYASKNTDPFGRYSLSEVFPFFKWLVAEVDFATREATGATIWVDNGGKLPIRRTPPVPVNPADPANRYNDILNPQPQPDNGGLNYRTETGLILLEGMLLYADQTNVIDWGKTAYLPGRNGGISGIVFYDSVRAENDPALNGGEPWQPGIPRVAVNLYADFDRDGAIDDVNGDGQVTLADVDNHPFDNFPGPEDIDRNGNGIWDGGDAIHSVHTDSWDDSLPTGCVNNDNTATPIAPYIDCAEMMRTWNQVRPAVFDGGYAFVSYFPGGIDSGSAEVDGLPSGAYIVETVPPYGYEVVKEEDKNVDFGDPFTPGSKVGIPPLAPGLPSTVPLCVGTHHMLRPYLSDGMTPNPSFDPMRPGKTTPLCDRKQVIVEDAKNAAADFFLFTAVPKAARMVGLITNDVLLEFNPNSPRKGDKLGPSWMPVSVRDWTGNEVVRVYSDEWGQYNSLVPSTWTSNVPAPSGVSPNMLTVHLNHPGPIESPPGSGIFVPDSFYNPAYSQIATNFDFWPGKTTYVDTPILPIAAFAGRGVLDCEFPDGTPVISQVDGPAGGPWVSQDNTLITITSLQDVSVAGVPRDFGFGDNGVVTLGAVPLDNVIWTPVVIQGRVPVGASTGQLVVTRRDTGRSTVMGITLHVGGGPPTRVVSGQSIQAAVDAALPGDLILVGPGVYRENIILWKPVKLQGNGAWSTVIDAGAFDVAAQDAWLAKLNSIIGTAPAGQLDWLVPGERADFFLERGAGITVLAHRSPDNVSFYPTADPARIDGFLVTGSVQGGGIFVNANAHHLRIGNNKLQSNQGTYGGGIRVGTPSIVATDAVGDPLPGATGYNSSFNDNLVIHNNHIDQNGAVGGLGGNGGGISLYNGSDDYTIRDSWICGNFAQIYGGGIAHFGLSPRGRIENNAILFNESFDEGGGIMIAGELVPGGAPAGTLTPGAGSVTVHRNLIQGNHGGDDGGGVRTLLFSGQDVANNPSDNTLWNRLDIVNNMIVNNVTADTGGGISLDDTASVNILHNTIARNDSTATGVDAFGGPCDPLAQFCGEGAPGGGVTNSLPQGAGLVSRAHSVGLQAASGQLFSDPVLYNNILWQNRSFFWNASINGGNGGLVPADNNAAGADAFWDLQVVAGGTGAQLKPRFCLLDNSVLGNAAVDLGATNVIPAPGDNVVSSPYFNVYEATSGGAAMGNFVTVVWTPLVLTGDYHLQASSLAVDRAAAAGTLPVGAATQGLLGVDFDLQVRPSGPAADIGADEFWP